MDDNQLLKSEYEGQVQRIGNNRRHLIKMADSPLLTKRGIPILLMLVCSLVIVNTRCDQVGSTNEKTKEESADKGNNNNNNSKLLSSTELIEQEVEQAEKQHQQAVANTQATKAASKYDPLNMLREIYLDQNSKVITMLMPPDNDPANDITQLSDMIATAATMQDRRIKSILRVLIGQMKSAPITPPTTTIQKFHPNGRYGRRSVDNNYAEPHSELAKLVYNEPSNVGAASTTTSLSPRALRGLLGNSNRVTDKQSTSDFTGINQSVGGRAGDMGAGGAGLASASNYQHELAKLLKCNYSGVSSLYWCQSAATTAAAASPY